MYETQTYPIEHLAFKAVNLAENTTDALWILQQAVFVAKIKLISYMVDNGKVRAGKPSFEIDVRIVQPVVDEKATDGKDIDIPKETYSISVLERTNEVSSNIYS